MSMNLANMIKEERLKKTFIIATLCSTMIGTFSSSIGLWDRMKERKKQNKRDSGQDDEIRKLKEKVEVAEKKAESHKQEKEKTKDDVGMSFESSGALISREFNAGFDRLGRRFAEGDALTENRLQAQIIQLQQTVINVLQDALATGRQLDHSDIAKLIAASDAARDNTIEALRDQRHRLAIEPPNPRGLSLPPRERLALDAAPRRDYSLPVRDRLPVEPMTPRRDRDGGRDRQSERGYSPPRRASTQIDMAEPMPRDFGPPKRASTFPEQEPLFCNYALDLQYLKNKPLSNTFAPGGGCRCPACNLRLDVESDDFWLISKRVGTDGSRPAEEREFHLGQRFIVKSHTPDGRYACVFCNQYRNADTVCSSIDSLINHVGRAHSPEELQREIDFEERSPSSTPPPAAIEAPPSRAPSVVGSKDGRIGSERDTRSSLPAKYR